MLLGGGLAEFARPPRWGGTENMVFEKGLMDTLMPTSTTSKQSRLLGISSHN